MAAAQGAPTSRNGATAATGTRPRTVITRVGPIELNIEEGEDGDGDEDDEDDEDHGEDDGEHEDPVSSS